MAITLEGSAKGYSLSGNPTCNFDSGESDVILVWGAVRGASSVTGVTDSQSNTYTLLATQSNSGGSLRLYKCESPTNNASLTITFNVSSGNDRFIIGAGYSNVADSYDGASYYGVSSASSSSVSITALHTEDIILCGGFEQGTTGIGGYGSGQTELQLQSSFGGYELAVTYETIGTVGANSQSFTNADKVAGLVLEARQRIFSIT